MPNHHNNQTADHTDQPESPSSVDIDIAERTRHSPNLGSEIRSLRNIHNMRIKDLADATGLSSGFISQIERSQNKPSLKALYDISRALKVNISWFFHAKQNFNPDEPHIVRSNSRRRLDFGEGIVDQLLVPNLSGSLELLLSTFEPGAGVDQAYTHNGEEAGHVLQGELKLWIDDKEYQLATGDSFSFKSSSPHYYKNTGTEKTVVIWAITPPSY